MECGTNEEYFVVMVTRSLLGSEAMAAIRMISSANTPRSPSLCYSHSFLCLLPFFCFPVFLIYFVLPSFSVYLTFSSHFLCHSFHFVCLFCSLAFLFISFSFFITIFLPQNVSNIDSHFSPFFFLLWFHVIPFYLHFFFICTFIPIFPPFYIISFCFFLYIILSDFTFTFSLIYFSFHIILFNFLFASFYLFILSLIPFILCHSFLPTFVFHLLSSHLSFLLPSFLFFLPSIFTLCPSIYLFTFLCITSFFPFFHSFFLTSFLRFLVSFSLRFFLPSFYPFLFWSTRKWLA